MKNSGSALYPLGQNAHRPLQGFRQTDDEPYKEKHIGRMAERHLLDVLFVFYGLRYPFAGSRSSHRKGVPLQNTAFPPWAAAICATSRSPVPWAAPPSGASGAQSGCAVPAAAPPSTHRISSRPSALTYTAASALLSLRYLRQKDIAAE